jgi:hypothetical protein
MKNAIFLEFLVPTCNTARRPLNFYLHFESDSANLLMEAGVCILRNLLSFHSFIEISIMLQQDTINEEHELISN